jgi:cytochrome o ubiquinol oxidase subunit 2
VDFLSSFLILNPAGAVGLAQRGLIINAVLLMLIVVVPVYVLLFFFAWRYRAGNKKAKYLPNWEHSKMDELIWWAVPLEIVLVLGALTWSSTQAFDPRAPLKTPIEPLVVQTVALDWKWLFIYPEQEIATVGALVIPKDTPIRFEITADAPMNSFWIPQLGGQIYAMTGMVNSLNLIASREGIFKGISANYSGDGFANMTFEVRAVSQDKFDIWVQELQESPQVLDAAQYEEFRAPSKGDRAVFRVETGLFDEILQRSQMRSSATNTQ